MSREEKRNINNNSNTMDINQLKNDHLSLYQKVFNQGVQAEKNRVGSWMAHLKADPDAVKKGINSGEEINSTQREEMLIKAASLSHVENIQRDSTPPIQTESPRTTDETEGDELDNFYKDVDNQLKELYS